MTATAKKRDIEPRQSDREKARRIARTSAKNDSWMRPVFEKGDDANDYGQFAMSHRGEWESTSQFQCWHGKNLTALAQEVARRLGLRWPEKTEDFDAYYYIYDELKNDFWEEWEEKVGLARVWNRERKRKK